MSLGYFAYDTISMALLGILDMDTIIHHGMCLVAFSYSLLTNAGSFYNCLIVVLGEFSNSPMHIRVMLRNINMRYTKLYYTATYLFFATYLFARVVGAHPVIYLACTCEGCPLLIKVCFIVLMLQSYQNFYRMYFVWKGVMRQSAELKQKGIELKWTEPLSNEELEKCNFYKKSQEKKVAWSITRIANQP